MKNKYLASRSWLLILAGAALCSAATGCQSTVGGQTLPSPNYLRDDLQYFPAGPEFKLTKQVQAMEEFKLRQQGVLLDEEQ
jgi:hypothetical protein